MAKRVSRKWVWILLTGIVATTAAIVVFILITLPKPVETNSPAPDFVLTSVDEQTVSLSNFKNKRVVLVFWASWCEACVAEFAALEKLSQTYKKDGLVVLAISKGESEKSVSAFLDERPVSFSVLLDQDESVSRSYGVWSLPTMYSVDESGRVADRVSGSIHRDGVAPQDVLVEHFKEFVTSDALKK